MALNVGALRDQRGLLKIAELLLALVTFFLARVGNKGYSMTFGGSVDGQWLGHVTVGGFLIIIPAVILGILLGDQIPWMMETILSVVGGILYLATGSLTIDGYNNIRSSDFRDVALALGSFSIITGIVLLIDSVLLFLKYRSK